MLTPDSPENKSRLTEIARACDVCLKPWRHSVIKNPNSSVTLEGGSEIDLSVVVECRTKEGERCPEHDLEIEIYRSGVDISITLSWISFPERPILWYGKHSIWMDSSTGLRLGSPDGGYLLESLARRLRSSFCLFDEDD